MIASPPGEEQNSAGAKAPPLLRRRSCARCGCWTIALLLVVLVAGFFTIRVWVVQHFGAEQWAQMKKWDTEMVALPPEWRRPKPLPSPEVLAFHGKFNADVNALVDKYGHVLFDSSGPEDASTTPVQSALMRLRHGDALTSGEEQALNSLATDFMPLAQQTSTAVAMPNYTADLNLYTTVSGLLAMQNFAKLSSVVALQQMRHGDCSVAMETAALPLRQIKHNQPSPLITDLISVACVYISISTMQAIAQQCSDTSAILAGLEELEARRGDLFAFKPELAYMADMVASVDRVRQFGYPIKELPQTQAQWSALSLEIYGKPYYQWAIKHFPADDPRALQAKAQLESITKYGQGEQSGLFNTFAKITSAWDLTKVVTGVSFGAMQRRAVEPNILETTTRLKVVRAAYNITMMQMADRLAELKAPARFADKTGSAAYLNHIPEDPFRDVPLQTNSNGAWYSYGPDKDDQGGKIPYDATNGTMSAGDVVMGWRR